MSILLARIRDGKAGVALGTRKQEREVSMSNNRLGTFFQVADEGQFQLDPMVVGIDQSNANRGFLDEAQVGEAFGSTQTVPPADLRVTDLTGSTITLSWTPIRYTGDRGGYRVMMRTSLGDSSEWVATVEDKESSSVTVTDLEPATEYFFTLRSFTNPHANNQNQVVSQLSEKISATTLPAAHLYFPLLLSGGQTYTG